MTTDDPRILSEDDKKCMMVTTGRVRSWDDQVPAWADTFIPDALPTYYFEVTLVNRGSDGPFHVGLFAANKPMKGFPGHAPGSFSINDDGNRCSEGVASYIEPLKANYLQPGDVLGVLLNRVTGKLGFSFNGNLVPDILPFNTHRRYYPAIGIGDPGARLHVNFGQRPFRYDISASAHIAREFRTGNFEEEEKKEKEKKRKRRSGTQSETNVIIIVIVIVLLFIFIFWHK